MNWFNPNSKTKRWLLVISLAGILISLISWKYGWQKGFMFLPFFFFWNFGSSRDNNKED